MCRCNVDGVIGINGQYRYQALVSDAAKKLRFQVPKSLKDMGATYSTQYLQAGLATTPNQQLPWLQASNPATTTQPIVIQGAGPVVGAKLRVDANIMSSTGVRCTVPVFIDFVSSLPALPSLGRQNGVQLSVSQKGL